LKFGRKEGKNYLLTIPIQQQQVVKKFAAAVNFKKLKEKEG